MNHLSEHRDDGRKKPYDLEDRTALFGEAVIDYVKKVPVTSVTHAKIYRGWLMPPIRYRVFRVSLGIWVFRHSDFTQRHLL